MNIKKFDRDMLKSGELFVRKKYDGKSFPTHRHDYYEMIMYRGCDGYCVFNGVRYEIEGDCVFFLTPTDFHRIECAEAAEGYSINASFSEKLIDERLLKSEQLLPAVLYSPSDYFIATMERLLTVFESASDDKVSVLEEQHLIAILLIMMIGGGEKVNSKALCVNQSIRGAMRYILTDVSRRYTLAEVAEKSGFSPTHFSYLFHKEIGMTFKSWLESIRIEHAKRLLESGDMKVLEVAMECGFGSASHFIRAFRENTGVTPKAWRFTGKS